MRQLTLKISLGILQVLSVFCRHGPCFATGAGTRDSPGEVSFEISGEVSAKCPVIPCEVSCEVPGEFRREVLVREALRKSKCALLAPRALREALSLLA